jgi:hypothetical protein
MKLADMQDLGSCAFSVQVQVLSPAPPSGPSNLTALISFSPIFFDFPTYARFYDEEML